MISIVIIGNGNVAAHLIDAFLASKEVNLVQVFARDIEKVAHLKHQTSTTNSLKLLKNADIIIIAVSDDAISDIADSIASKSALVVHTSGGASINLLKNNSRKGVFYPLQSFSKDKKVDFKTIPLCLEAQTNDDLMLLEKLALTIGNAIYHINSKQRKQLHIAAVFVNNFVNHLYHIGSDICEKHDIPFEILHPLIIETASKIQQLSPKNAQTGPAIRNDQKTLISHLKSLCSQQQYIYKILTKSIQENGKKL
ncbi:DUF2520 domain-containing protein [Tenacibaculum maritimum]|uniref:Rossmann-like and DUF2520 domain-containing protein n=1 Tax=Tenacibaculum maritimum TaxID=107401 RepID=UPI0012E625B1|nr:Rossmann-like and DUF2520 domain-containing protein [Tenacibaculum maritimum]CAA0235471.1 conserved hypothetical protein [Tenacibaculum maritimum]